MNSLKIIAGGLTLMAVMGSAAACSSQPTGPVDVLQYGYYTPSHVYVTYPQPVVVHVTRSVYNSDHRMYSTPTYERTYIKTHKVTRTTTTTIHH